MSEDTFTEVTTESWFGRIGGAFKGIIVGLVLFVAAFPVLFWNEGRAVRRYKTLNEGSGILISVPEARVMSENDGKLVHVSGMAVTDEIVADPEFEVAVNAIKLKRKVEMYQWKERKKSKTKKKLGGGKKTVTTYSYSRIWSTNLINSRNFRKPDGHQNPDSMRYQSKEFVASEIHLGEFKLSRSLVGKINQSSKLPVTGQANIDDIPDADFHGEGIYVGNNPSSPQIGDLRITYHIVAPTEVSIVSKQVGQSFEPFHAQAGGTINMLNVGIVGAENMFRQAHQSNAMWTWIFRLGGFIVMLVGVTMILKPLSVVADVIPFLGGIVGAGTGILSFLIAAPFSFFTVAIAWLRYRPVLGISLIILAAVAAAVIFVLVKRGKPTGVSSPAGSDLMKTKDDKNLVPGKINRASTAKPGPPESGEIAAANIEKIPQTAKVEPNSINAADLLKRGQNYFQTGQYDQAVVQFSRAIKSGVNRKVALYNRGVALFKLNKKEAALKDFEHAAKLGHEKAKAVLNRVVP